MEYFGRFREHGKQNNSASKEKSIA
jgi:hypothetical protein